MSYRPRMKVSGWVGGYHIVTRSVLGQKLIGADYKYSVINVVKMLKEKLFLFRLAAFSAMDNHYHLLVRFADPEDVNRDEAMKRWNEYHKDTPYVRDPKSEVDREYVVRELTDVSSFVKRLNMLLTFQYNRETGNKGTIWESTFRSSVVERGISFVKVGSYIELNGFRAGLVERPEEYRFNSFYYMQHGNPGKFVDVELIRDVLFSDNAVRQGVKDEDFLTRYLMNIYESGKVAHRDEHGIPEDGGIVITETMMQSLREEGLIILTEGKNSLQHDTYLSDKVYGSDDFVGEMMMEYYAAYVHNKSDTPQDTDLYDAERKENNNENNEIRDSCENEENP